MSADTPTPRGLAELAAAFDLEVRPREQGGLEIEAGERGWRNMERARRLKVSVTPLEIAQTRDVPWLLDNKACFLHLQLDRALARRGEAA